MSGGKGAFLAVLAPGEAGLAAAGLGTVRAAHLLQGRPAGGLGGCRSRVIADALRAGSPAPLNLQDGGVHGHLNRLGLPKQQRETSMSRGGQPTEGWASCRPGARGSTSPA